MSRPRSNIKERFLSKVQKMENGCLEWTSTIGKDGYGKFYFEGDQEKSHRISYKLFNGEIPKGKWVLHKCDNRKCVNPEHLFIGNCKDNIQDMDEKGRRGTRSKLTYAQVEEIKGFLEARYTQQHIAALYGVDQTTISRIKLTKSTLFKK